MAGRQAAVAVPAEAQPEDGGYEALRTGAGALDIGREVVRVAGPDAGRYLQGQLSQDVARLSPGDWAWSLVLQPQGKLDAFVRCLRLGPDEFFLDTDLGVGELLVQRLLRFRLRTKADVDLLPWRAVAVRGPGAVRSPAGEGVITVPFEWGGLSGYDLMGPEPTAPASLAAVSGEAYEAARVEAGFPRHGAELDERTIPAEAGLVQAAVSFTKGCYTGQELVARIDSRGSNVPRHLRGFLLSGPAAAGDRLYPHPDGPAQELTPPAGEQAGGRREAGWLTSVARSPRLGWVALGYAARSVEVGATLVVRPAPSAASDEQRGGPVATETAQVQLLPLVGP